MGKFVQVCAMGGCKIDQCDLKVAPSTEELKKARETLASWDNKKKKSCMASMAQWLKQHPDKIVATSRAGERQKYMEAFLVQQLKSSGVIAKRSEHTKERNIQVKKLDVMHHWSREKMDLELGKEKAEKYRLSGKLDHHPDPVTHEDCDIMRVWEVPEILKQTADMENTGHKISTMADATESELALMQEMGSPHTGITGSSTDLVANAEVKKEPLSQQEQEKQDFDEFVNSIDQSISKHQKQQAEVLALLKVATMTKYAEGLTTDLQKHKGRITSILKLLVKASTEIVDDKMWKKMSSAMQQITDMHTELMVAAKQFGIKCSSGGQKRKRP